MSTQQDIYAASSKNRPPMLNKDNYVPWSSSSVTDDELTEADIKQMEADIKQMEADDQAIQTILLGLPEDIYAAVDSCETTQEIWLHVQQMMKGSDIGAQEKKAKLFNKWERFTSIDGESIESYYHRFSKIMNELKRNKYFPKKIANNLKFLNNLQPEWKRHITIVRQTMDLHYVDYTQLYDFLKMNQEEFGQYIVQNVGNQVVQNPGVQNFGNQNGLIVFLRIPHHNGIRKDKDAQLWRIGSIMQGTAQSRPRVRDAAYLQTQLFIAQKEEAKIQLQAKEYDLMSVAADIDEIEEVNANCILMTNLQQASTSGIQTDKAPIYDSDGSAEVHCDNGYNNDDIFNMFTQEDQYYELREPIPESHLVR
ncbi:hypothetical protein Tco_1203644 [Tanacetum coccineum]